MQFFGLHTEIGPSPAFSIVVEDILVGLNCVPDIPMLRGKLMVGAGATRTRSGSWRRVVPSHFLGMLCFLTRVSSQVVTHSDMMEMLTNYEYTIDVTSDADGAVETFGTEAGYGIISAEQMLGWIASNCQEACPGG